MTRRLKLWDINVLDAIKNLNPKAIFIVTNQGGIEKGLFPESFIYVKCEYVNDSIMDYCDINTRFMYCGSNDRNNPMRKPNTGMLEELFNNYKSLVMQAVLRDSFRTVTRKRPRISV